MWITRNALSGHHAPSVRVGGNHGSAVERAGDYFGTTINVAARVSALARGGEPLVTGATAAPAAGPRGGPLQSPGPPAPPGIAGTGGDSFRRSPDPGARDLA